MRAKKTSKKLTAQAAKWNSEHPYPPGTQVVLSLDLGGEILTKTRSIAWILGENSRGEGGHNVVVLVEGKTGGYSLDCIHLVPQGAA